MHFYSRKDSELYDKVEFLFIQTELKGHVFHITLNRPEKRNAFTPTMAEEITFALTFAHYNPEVRCVILNANGTVFCAGADLIAFHNPDVDLKNETLPAIREEVKLGDAFAQLLKPSIAVVEGPVLAGGFLMICGCTFVLGVESSTFSLPEVKRGIWPMQVMASLLQIMPPRKVLEMSITGKSYSAQEAVNLGLVTEIFGKDTIKDEAQKLASLISSNAPYAISVGMKALQNLAEIPQSEQQTFLKKQLNKLLESEDAKEGTIAFKEKRNPVWKGR
ncbi:enoyl-CoA hydratase/isomerase family protein [Dyadobacter sp. CY312]|uniref:enoyl-CoA hydratase/isomerase family protein n=1 Tax=Dyadobacter sp. CY312 TaxID=2907303 RepID=UPI001F1BC9F4|nr:enoyl-CoA hydratase-related protein [Dyadobacter sp. CY312]MCE7041169.1 enoyl-CoA hydratase-related protein [Dyadobacter sp. CY312]